LWIIHQDVLIFIVYLFFGPKATAEHVPCSDHPSSYMHQLSALPPARVESVQWGIDKDLPKKVEFEEVRNHKIRAINKLHCRILVLNNL
jgi:hypothetical protein